MVHATNPGSAQIADTHRTTCNSWNQAAHMTTSVNSSGNLIKFMLFPSTTSNKIPFPMWQACHLRTSDDSLVYIGHVDDWFSVHMRQHGVLKPLEVKQWERKLIKKTNAISLYQQWYRFLSVQYGILSW